MFYLPQQHQTFTKLCNAIIINSLSLIVWRSDCFCLGCFFLFSFLYDYYYHIIDQIAIYTLAALAIAENESYERNHKMITLSKNRVIICNEVWPSFLSLVFRLFIHRLIQWIYMIVIRHYIHPCETLCGSWRMGFFLFFWGKKCG